VITVNPSSINDLLALHAAGAPVSLTSHPGNASLYKLSLWQCGIPEYLWDVTCCVADANNWPMYRLQNGEAQLLIGENLFERIRQETNPNRRFITAYQFTKDGERLGRFHVRACGACFPKQISSCSRLLLSEESRVREMFAYLAETCGERVFGRFITPDGVMKPIRESGIKKQDFADSFIGVLHELNQLLFTDDPITVRGGACYDGVMVHLATMLVQYWQTGRIDRYDVSGPDMIHYASRKEHQDSLTTMLKHLRQWNPQLVPETFVVRMFPGTAARVGHVTGHVSEKVMTRKLRALRHQEQLSSEEKRRSWEAAREDDHLWPIQIQPNQDHYFSQHDLLLHGNRLVVHDFWKDVSLESMKETLGRADALLRIKRGKY
jgi:hypothetical protein